MLSSTVYQGKRAGSWKTTARLGSGPSTGAPFAHTWPRVGRSKPATMLRSVDLPQPEGPRIAANSLGATAKSIARTASTRRPPLTNSFQTSRSSAARRGAARGRRGEDDLAENRRLAGAQHPRGAQQEEIRIAHAVRRVHDDRIEGTQADEEERAGVVDPEDGDGEGEPRRDGHGAEELDRGVDQGRREPVPADHEAKGDPDAGGDGEALAHAAGRVEHVGEPGPRVGREALARRADDPR